MFIIMNKKKTNFVTFSTSKLPKLKINILIMAGEGFIAYMIVSLKANKRNRISTFDKIKSYKKSKKSVLHFDKKATPFQLKKIRNKIIKENETIFRRKVIVLLILISILLISLNFIE